MDTEVKKPWSKGAMRAARQLGQFHGLAAQTISRETKDQELSDLLLEYRSQHDICNVDDDLGQCPCETCIKAEALLSTLDGGTK